MKSTSYRFLMRYWLWSIVLPSLIIPTFSFFVNFSDLYTSGLSVILDEATKYLAPAVLIFLTASGVVAIIAIASTRPLFLFLERKTTFGVFKALFILVNCVFLIVPFVFWLLLHGTVGTQYVSIVIPAYLSSLTCFGLLFVKRNGFVLGQH